MNAPGVAETRSHTAEPGAAYDGIDADAGRLENTVVALREAMNPAWIDCGCGAELLYRPGLMKVISRIGTKPNGPAEGRERRASGVEEG